MHSKVLASGWLVLTVSLACLACGGSQEKSPEPPASQDATTQLPPGHPPTGTADPNAMLPTPVMGEGAALTWEMPEGWTSEPPSNPMRQAQYRVPGPAGDGTCVVYYFGTGQGGGPQANAERWADQFEQPDGSPSHELLETETIEVNGIPTLLVEVTGTYKEGGMMMTGGPQTRNPGYMLKGAIVEGPDAHWFFKLTGPEATVKANSDQFRALIGSVQGPS